MKENKIYEIQKQEDRFIRYTLSDPTKMSRINYTLNLDRYELFISGESRGSFKWVETKESFIDMLSRSKYTYLLERMFIQDVFDLEGSINEICDVVRNYGFEDDYQEELLEEIKAIDAVDKYDLLKQVYYQLDIDHGDIIELENQLEESIKYEYSYWAEVACKLFIEQIVPLLLGGNE